MSDDSTNPSKATPSGRRSLTNYVDLSRAPIESHYRMLVDNLAPGVERPPLENFDSSSDWHWLSNWVKATYKTNIESIFKPSEKKHAFSTYPATGEQGHYDLAPLAAADGSIRIALAGDWGSGTDVSHRVTTSMVSASPELTIHLGDIYYVGTEDEVKQNCLGVSGKYTGVEWLHGTKGSFALNGNHEMYSGGHGYFDFFLPTLGIPTSQDMQQLASYFCLETPVWRILGIDTGYNSDTLAGHAELEPELLHWLESIIDPVKNRKPTILLSHHQWFSGFNDGSYNTPANQIAPFFQNQEIVWLWAHEHRLAIYNKFISPTSSMVAYARCIGHGGLPVQMPESGYPNNSTNQKVEYWDGNTATHPERFHKLTDGTIVGTNGYALMTIQHATLTLEYFDADRTSVFKETITPGGGAACDGTLTRTILNDPGILTKTGF